MRTKPNRRLLTHRDVAAMISVDTETLRDWVEKGEFPRPHSKIERTMFFRAEVIEHWLDTGDWPEAANFKPGEGKGRNPAGE